MDVSAARGGDGERIDSGDGGGAHIDGEGVGGGRGEGYGGRNRSYRETGWRARGERDGSAEAIDRRERQCAGSRSGGGDLQLGVLDGEREIRLGNGDVDGIGGGGVVIGVALVDGGEDAGSIGGSVAGNDERRRALVQGCDGEEALAVGEEEDGSGGGWHAGGTGGGRREGKALVGRGAGRAGSEGNRGRELAGQRNDHSAVGGAAQPIAVSGVGGGERQEAGGETAEGDDRFEGFKLCTH